MSKIDKTDAEWRAQLDEETYRVTREKGTERPYTGRFYQHQESGTYHCVCCDAALFRSDSKYDAGCGWPSFSDAIEGAVTTREDRSHGMIRTEILCARCDAHLGHVFDDGPTPSGQRFCVNSVSLDFDDDPSAAEDS